MLIFFADPQKLLTGTEMCIGATACCTAVTQFKDFFITTASAWRKKAKPSGHSSHYTLLQHLRSASFNIVQPFSPQACILILVHALAKSNNLKQFMLKEPVNKHSNDA